MTRVVFAPDSLKGTVSAAGAASALAAGWRSVDPALDAVVKPMADGGEGTLDAFALAVPTARRVPVSVSAPRSEDTSAVAASWLLLPPDIGTPRGTAVVELASTAGIELFGDRLDPWGASSFGFGEAIVAAIDAGVSRIVLAIGSSASTDGGAGMLAALGARFSGAGDRRWAARDLSSLTDVDLRGLRRAPAGGVIVLSDVTNPLLGPRGAARVFGPQKGFDPEETVRVDDAMRSFSRLFRADPSEPGAGAAGGVGFAALAWGARLRPGAPAVAELIGLADAARSASLVVTGEGRYDAQSGSGKVPMFVAEAGGSSGPPTVLVAGSVAPDADVSPFAHVISLTELAGSADAAMAEPARWLRAAGAALARRFAPPH